MARIWLSVLFLSGSLILSTSLINPYRFVDQHLNWTEAQTYCRQTYTDLATIESDEEVKQLLDQVPSASYTSDIWIGVYNKINWRWSDGFNGSGAEYRKWYYSEPDLKSADEFCVSMYSDQWYDFNCKLYYPSVCYTGSQQSPKYVYVSQPMNWSGAQSYCRNKYIDLATVKNLEENSMISTTMASPYKWIGLFRDPDFYWSDGRNFTFSKWEGANNPLNSDRVVCGIISPQRSGKWKFRPCETKLPFVCYIDPIRTKVVKMRLKVEGSVDLNDPDVKAEILEKLQERLTENEVSVQTLKWKEQPDGEVFHKEEERKKTEL